MKYDKEGVQGNNQLSLEQFSLYSFHFIRIINTKNSHYNYWMILPMTTKLLSISLLSLLLEELTEPEWLSMFLMVIQLLNERSRI